MVSPRSFLYVPGNDAGKLDGALGRGADVVIADLEDAVPPARKDESLAIVVDWLAGAAAAARVPCWVRLDADEGRWPVQLDAVVDAGAAGLLIPKADCDRLERVVERLDDRSADVQVGGLLETAAALRDLDSIAAVPRLRHLALGEADLCAELGIERSDGDPELAPLRMQLVLASTAAGLAPPVASTSTDFRDLVALRRGTEQARRMGFRGRTAVHPAQLAVINEVFTPSADEVAAARDVMRRYEAALGEKRGVAVDASGRMIDEAVVRSARRVLAYAR